MTGVPAAGEVRLRIADSAAMRELGRALAGVVRRGDLIVLSGPLGAGKTTLTQGLGDGLGVRGPVTSPTFVLARSHPPLGCGPALVHVDAFRLGDAVEVDDLDLDADMADSVTVVEWGEGKVDHLSADRLDVLIECPATDQAQPPRVVTVRGHGPRWDPVDLAAAVHLA